MSEKNGLVKNASFLMMATLISRVIGLLYRSPLGVMVRNQDENGIRKTDHDFLVYSDFYDLRI